MSKNEILKASAKLFKEKGFYNTSIREISENVGIKSGSLYYHFRSKDDALFHVCESAVNVLLSEEEKIVSSDDGPKEKLTKLIENLIDYFINNFYETVVFLIETKALTGNYQKMYIQKRDRYELYVREIIKEGISKRVFRKGNAKLMTFSILGILNWMIFWYRPDGKWAPRDLKKEFIKTVFSGIENEGRLK